MNRRQVPWLLILSGGIAFIGFAATPANAADDLVAAVSTLSAEDLWHALTTGFGNWIGYLCGGFFAVLFVAYLVLEIVADRHRSRLEQSANTIHTAATESPPPLKEAAYLDNLKLALEPVGTARADQIVDKLVISDRVRSLGPLRSDLPDEAVGEQVSFWKVRYSLTHLMPTLFTSVGMLGTFAGVAAGLGHLSGTGDVAVEVGGVIQGLSAAFSTSIVGLLLALIVHLLNHYLHGRLLRAFEQLRVALDHLAAPITAEELLHRQSKQLDEIRRDGGESRGLLQTLMSDLGDRFEQGISGLLVPELQTLTEAVRKQVGEASDSAVESARAFTEELAGQFTTELQDSFQTMSQSVQTFSTDFGQAGDSLTRLLDRLEASVQSQDELVQTQIRGVGQASQVLDAASGLPDLLAQIEGSRLMSERAAADQAEMQLKIQTQSATSSEHIERAARRYAETAQQLERALANVSDHVVTLSRSVGTAVTNTEAAATGFQEAANTLSQRVKAEQGLLTEYRGAAQAFEASFRAGAPLLERLARLSNGLGELGTQLKAEAESSTRSIDRIQAVSKVMEEQLGQAANALRDAGSGLGGVAAGTTEWASAATRAIEGFEQGMSKALASTLREYDGSLSRAVTALGGSIRELEDIADAMSSSRTSPGP